MNPKICHFKFKETSARDIYQNLKSLKRKKSSGYDESLTTLIIDGAGVLCAPISLLISASLRNSIFPTTEKCAKISLIDKSGGRYTMDNYQPFQFFLCVLKLWSTLFIDKPMSIFAKTISCQKINLDLGEFHLQNTLLLTLLFR